MKNRTALWFGFFVCGFLAFINFLGYFSDLTDTYQTSEGLHVPTFSNTPVPLWLIIWSLITILIVVFIIKSVVAQRKEEKKNIVVSSNVTTVSKEPTSPLFKSIILFILCAVGFYVFVVLALGGSFEGFFGEYFSGISSLVHNPEGLHVWRIAGVGLMVLILLIVAIVDKIKANKGK